MSRMQHNVSTLILLFLLALLSCNPNEDNERSWSQLSGDSIGISFENKLKESTNLNILKYLYFYNGAGVGVGDFNNDGLKDLYFVSNQGDNGLFYQDVPFKFIQAPSDANVQGNSSWQSAVSVVDINGDGWDDIYVCAVVGTNDFTGHHELYVNNQDGTFTESSANYGLDARCLGSQAIFADFDNDDDLDLYLVNHSIHSQESHANGERRRIRDIYSGDRLLMNIDGKYQDKSEYAGIYGGVTGYGLSGMALDINQDNHMDIYVTNDFHENDYLYINNGDGTFKESIEDYFHFTPRFSMGMDAADVNNDGLTDIICVDMLPYDEQVIKSSDPGVTHQISQFLVQKGFARQYSRNMLQIADSTGHYTDCGYFAGISATDWSWAPLFIDYNLDGLQDIFISTGIVTRPNDLDFINFINSGVSGFNSDPSFKIKDGISPNKLFLGNQNNNYKEVIIDNEPHYSTGAVYVDLDNDGMVEIVTNNINSSPTIYRSEEFQTNNWIGINLNYLKSNINGVGSYIKVHQRDHLQTKLATPHRGFLSSVDKSIVFGINKAFGSIDSIVVVWPGGKRQKMNQWSLDQYNVFEFDENNLVPSIATILSPKADVLSSNAYSWSNDLTTNPIIPRGYSSFPGNVSQAPDGEIMSLGLVSKLSDNLKSILPDEKGHVSDISYLDINQNGMTDVIVTYSHKMDNTEKPNCDYLYLNENGNYRKIDFEQTCMMSTTSVCATDFDSDDDSDIILAAIEYSKEEGIHSRIFLLEQIDNGEFKEVSNHGLTYEGNIMDMLVFDFNEDGKSDLLFVGEYSYPKVYINKDGRFEELSAWNNMEMNGLWQYCQAIDLDGDQTHEIILGNWGLNNKLASYLDNGSLASTIVTLANIPQRILCYSYNDEPNSYYPINTRDEIAKLNPSIKKKYNSYSSFAGEDVDQVFGIEVSSNLERITNLKNGYLKKQADGRYEFVPFESRGQMGPLTYAIPDKERSNTIKIGGQIEETIPLVGKLVFQERIDF